ncbi:hypothetical protein [Anaerocolumna sp. MB42-C2]|uniref:hypothetical protein n=1 Tax=Anaerocolumna sp. MB42-C2 TaxID=3070997 RepID=UPI0027E17092|nr:hypothetical protein [Anaerocolumna sp. MB42-C2]WMJ90275.1 hypothetical protein RBU59_12310 [Anaerocolumna sp. MB42-C2]
MTTKVTQYQFDKICTQMKNQYGTIKKGSEDGHSMMLFPMEGNLLKIHRKNPTANSRRLLEAISLALFQIKGYLTDEEYDISSFQTAENEKLLKALLMAFDPFTNKEIHDALEQTSSIDLNNRGKLQFLFQEPIICMLRIKDSVDMLIKSMGADGYFTFTEQYMGSSIPQDEDMKYSIYIGD